MMAGNHGGARPLHPLVDRGLSQFGVAEGAAHSEANALQIYRVGLAFQGVYAGRSAG